MEIERNYKLFVFSPTVYEYSRSREHETSCNLIKILFKIDLFKINKFQEDFI